MEGSEERELGVNRLSWLAVLFRVSPRTFCTSISAPGGGEQCAFRRAADQGAQGTDRSEGLRKG